MAKNPIARQQILIIICMRRDVEMDTDKLYVGYDPEYAVRLKEIRNLSRQFLQAANIGITRAEYLKQVVTSIKAWAGCHSIRSILYSTNRRFFGELDSARKPDFRFEVSIINASDTAPLKWRYSPLPTIEKICLDIMEMRTDSAKPWFTAFGSFWTNDVRAMPDTIIKYEGCPDYDGIRIDENARSVILIPVDGARGRLGIMQIQSNQTGFFNERKCELLERLVQMLGFALDWRNLQVALRERVKELTCLYGIARLVAQAESSLDAVLQNAVNLLPPAWLFPDVAAGKIVFDNHIYATPGIDRVVQKMKADIIVGNTKRGEVEVGYTDEKPPIDEGPFLIEERNLIDTIANELSFIIEQKLHSEEKQRLQSQLRRADRLATIGQLAAGVAHELNEPLANIMGFAQLAAKDTGLAEQTKKDLGKIVSATLHAREIIKDLLTFARETETIKVKFNLNDLITDGLFFLESRFTKAGIKLVCELSKDLPDIMADRSQILQVITNLAVNSVQAMPEGGKLKIKTWSEDNSIYMTVEDTGVGIEKKILNKIFNPFFTTKDVNEGTGLGLSVVHGIITSHNGDIDVESRKNHGTRFTIRLPVETSEQD